MLTKRIITTLIVLPPVLGLLYLGGTALVIFSLLVYLLMNYEYYTIALSAVDRRRDQFCLVSLLIPGSYILYGWPGLFAGMLLAFMAMMSVHLIHIEGQSHQPDFSKDVPSTVMGLCYVGCLGAVFTIVSLEPLGNLYLMGLLAVVAMSDTCAYFGGKLFGKTKSSPRISPNKTIVGVVSGFFGALIAAMVLGVLFTPEKSIAVVLLYGITAGGLAQTGDLVGSLMKRIHGVKDSGTLLPGHGGVIDRVDGLLFAAPILFFM